MEISFVLLTVGHTTRSIECNMDFYINIMSFVLGLCVGSFINMAIYRYAINCGLESEKFKVKSKNRSFCDFCGRQLRWYENVPIISWLIQGGKSRCCQTPLPWSYPIVELMVGMIFMVVGLDAISLTVAALLVFSAVFDAKYMILPDFSTYILILIGLYWWQNWWVALMASGFLLFLHLITKGKGMGMGDVKLAIFMGLLLGWPNIIIAMYVAFISGAVVGLICLGLKKKNRKSEIAFGPFLILGTGVAWYYGSRIWEIIGRLLW